jgi:predicted nucleic acid-binding protein
MPVEKIVINASPLILLCNCNLAGIVPLLFREIVIPDAVWQEIVSGPHQDCAARMLPALPWVTQRPAVIPCADVVRWDLGEGETAVLSFAARNKAFTPVLDDMAAKRCAASLGLPTLGTGSLMIVAKEHGLIKSVEEAMLRLRQAGLWIADPVIQLLKAQAGE